MKKTITIILKIIMLILAVAFKRAVPMGLSVVGGLAGFLLGWEKIVFAAVPAAVILAVLEWILLMILGKKPLGKHYKVVFALSVGIVVAILAGDYVRNFIGF